MLLSYIYMLMRVNIQLYINVYTGPYVHTCRCAHTWY